MRASINPAPGWKWSKVKHTAEFHTGWTPPTGDADSFEGDNLWANISDLGPKALADTRKRISDRAVQKSAIKVSPAGSVLFSFKLSIGQVSFAQRDMYTNEAIATFPPQSKLNARWAYYALPVFVPENANENIYGAKLLNQELIRSADLLVPPPDAQERIANFLDEQTARIDALIAEKRRLLEQLAEYRTLTIRHTVLGQGSPTRNMTSGPLREPWVELLPRHWKCPKVKHICRTTSGSTPNTDKREVYYDGEIPWIRSLDLPNGDITKAEVFITEAALRDTACKQLPVGTVLLAMYGGDGTIGKSGLLRIEAACNQALCAILPNRAIEPRFLHWYMVFRRPYWMVGADGTRKDPNISQDVVREARLPLPPLSEQIEIADYLDAWTIQVDALSQHVEEHIDRLREYRASLISAAVTGQLDINSYKEAA